MIGLVNSEAGQPAIYRNLSFAEYRRVPGVSQSMLKGFRRTPLHAAWDIANPKEATDAMILGQAIDTAILSRSEFDQRFAVWTGGRRQGKAWDEFCANTEGKIALRSDDAQVAMACRESALAHPAAGRLLTASGARQLAVTATISGVEVKGLLDLVSKVDGEWWVCDLKSCQSASPDGFRSAIFKMAYHWQAALYLELLNLAAWRRKRRWAWICVETSPPYAVAVYEAGESLLEFGRAEVSAAIADFKRCQDSGRWPGYGDGVQTLDAPRWWRDKAYSRVTSDVEAQDEHSGDGREVGGIAAA